MNIIYNGIFVTTDLKCGFYYYSGIVKPTDEMTVIDRITGYLQFPGGGGAQWHSWPYETVQRSVRRQRGAGKAWTTAFITVFTRRNGKGKVKQTDQV